MMVARRLILSVLLLLFSACATEIADYQSCALVPNNLGAVCDNFLTSNQLTLTEAQWEALEASWNTGGDAAVCLRSSAATTIKGEFEKLCSRTPCDEDTKQKIMAALDKIEVLKSAALRKQGPGQTSSVLPGVSPVQP